MNCVMRTLTKGMRVQAEIWKAVPPGTVALAGIQVKTQATLSIVEGEVTSIKGNHPTNPTSVGVWIKTDEGYQITVDSKNIVAIM